MRNQRSEFCKCAATYVDKILKGVKPADLPVEQPKKFEFIIPESGEADRPDDSAERAGESGQRDQVMAEKQAAMPGLDPTKFG